MSEAVPPSPYAFLTCTGIAVTSGCWSFDAGDLERLRRYWMTGTCKPGKQEHKSSDPLALEQFLSAFLLLMSGILLAAVLLALEHVYFKYVRKRLAKTDRGGCCALISLVSMATGWHLISLVSTVTDWPLISLVSTATD
jgi:hypothetical protein